MPGQETSDMNLWLLIILAVIIIFALYWLSKRRKAERALLKTNPDVGIRQRERFEKTSRYALQTRVISARYPALKLHPQIVENILLDDARTFKRFDFERELARALTETAKWEDVIQQAARYSAQRSMFEEELSSIHQTTHVEAAALNIKLDDCLRFEESWREKLLPSSQENFVTYFVQFSPSSGEGDEKTFHMGFDEFRSFCRSRGELQHIDKSIENIIKNESDTREAVRSQEVMKHFITKEQFDAAYESNHGIDRPGVYIILIYDAEQRKHTLSNYSDVYVGQSAMVYHRVRQHFSGHGNGDVYADIKFGKTAYVQLVFCEERELNDLEKKYIAEYNATASYNNTRGGAAARG